MKKYLFAIAIFLIFQTSQAQSFNYEMLGTDSVEFYMKLDSAVKATPDFGFTMADTGLLLMQIFMPETIAALTEIFEDYENYDPYENISAHLEGGWEVASISANDEYYLIKPHRGDKYWIKQLNKSFKDQYYKSSLILYKIDCTEGMLGIVQATKYDSNGKVEYSSPTRDDIIVNMSYAEPETIGEALLDAACK